MIRVEKLGGHQHCVQDSRHTGVTIFLLVERENYVDGGIHFNRFAIEQRWLIAPLTNGVLRSIHQRRMTRYHRDLSYRSVLKHNDV
jgi:hypothetical protein